MQSSAKRFSGAFIPVPTIDESIVRAVVAQRQPYYAVPSKFIFRDTLPMTSNGKIDKRALLASVAGTFSTADIPKQVEPAVLPMEKLKRKSSLRPGLHQRPGHLTLQILICRRSSHYRPRRDDTGCGHFDIGYYLYIVGSSPRSSLRTWLLSS